MADIRSFFGGKPAGDGKKPAAPAVAAKKESKPSPLKKNAVPPPAEPAPAESAPARKRLRRNVLAEEEEDDDDGVVAAVERAAPARTAAAASPASALACTTGSRDAAVVRRAEPAAVSAAGTAAAAAADVADSDADSDGDDAEGPKVPSPLLGKLRQAGDVKAKSKGTLDNMRVAYDAAKAFSLERVSASWQAGQPVPYSFLVGAFDKCAQTTKRLEITQIMVDALRAVLELSPADLLPTLYLSLNILGPSFAGIELGLGDALLLKAVAETCGRQEKQLKAELDEEGDLGAIAMASRSTQRLMFTPAALTVRKVFATYLEIAKLAGKDCMTKKRDKVKQLLVAARESEAMYVVRGLQGKLRVGLAEQTVLTALAHALVLSPPAAVGVEAPALKKLGVEGLHDVLAEAEAVRAAACAQPSAGARAVCQWAPSLPNPPPPTLLPRSSPSCAAP
jgi:DNA ligase-1